VTLRYESQEYRDFTWRVSDCEELVGAELLIMFWRESDCEELVGGYSQEMIGLIFGC